jgi:hypothetical protein
MRRPNFHAWSEEFGSTLTDRDKLIFDISNAVLNRFVYALPVDIFGIIHALGIRTLTAADYEQLGMTREELFSVWGNEDGAAGRICGREVINYNEKKPPLRIRFTLAEELMHILLGHTADPSFGADRSYSSDTYAQYEHEAKTAAGLVFIPAQVYIRHRGASREAIARVCNVSAACAFTTAKWYEEHLDLAMSAATSKFIQYDRKVLKNEKKPVGVQYQNWELF